MKDYSVFDLSGNWQINDMVSLRAGVDDVLNTDPVRIGKNTGSPQHAGGRLSLGTLVLCRA